jgi:hypothetical protein
MEPTRQSLDGRSGQDVRSSGESDEPRRRTTRGRIRVDDVACPQSVDSRRDGDCTPSPDVSTAGRTHSGRPGPSEYRPYRTSRAATHTRPVAGRPTGPDSRRRQGFERRQPCRQRWAGCSGPTRVAGVPPHRRRTYRQGVTVQDSTVRSEPVAPAPQRRGPDWCRRLGRVDLHFDRKVP